MPSGKLYLIPSLIAEENIAGSIPPLNIGIIQGLAHFIVEDLRTARRFLRLVGYKPDFETVVFYELSEHTPLADLGLYIQPLLSGENVGLISEAGVPCVADPGSGLVYMAHQNNIQVVPLIGPNSILLALMASGLNGQGFTFHGYLPIDKNERKQALKRIEKEAMISFKTQIFIETPYRNKQLLEAILNYCSPELKLSIACNLNGQDEFIGTKTLKEWKSEIPDIHKKPAVFLINY